MSSRKLKEDDEVQCDFYVVGKVKMVSPLEVVNGKNGNTYEKRTAVIDCTTNSDYPTDVHVEFFAKTINEKAKEMVPGDKVAVAGSVASRMNATGKAYTTCKAFFVRFISRSARRPTGEDDATHRVAGKYTEEGVEEIPF